MSKNIGFQLQNAKSVNEYLRYNPTHDFTLYLQDLIALLLEYSQVESLFNSHLRTEDRCRGGRHGKVINYRIRMSEYKEGETNKLAVVE